jgi:hypothetical protein
MTVIDAIGLVVARICLNSHGEEKWSIRGERAPELRILVLTCNTLRSERPRFPGGLRATPSRPPDQLGMQCYRQRRV